MILSLILLVFSVIALLNIIVDRCNKCTCPTTAVLDEVFTGLFTLLTIVAILTHKGIIP